MKVRNRAERVCNISGSREVGGPCCKSTDRSSIALDQAGSSYRVPGTLISKIQPVTGGHLITVTGTFQTPGRPFSVSLQTIVNEYSGGQE